MVGFLRSLEFSRRLKFSFLLYVEGVCVSEKTYIYLGSRVRVCFYLMMLRKNKLGCREGYKVLYGLRRVF